MIPLIDAHEELCSFSILQFFALDSPHFRFGEDWHFEFWDDHSSMDPEKRPSGAPRVVDHGLASFGIIL